MRITSIPCLSDNYAYLVVCDETGEAAIVDVPDAAPVAAAIDAAGVKVGAIWSTHHHADHVGGNDELCQKLGITDVVGHVSDRGRIPRQTKFVDTGDTFALGKLGVRVLHIPGHTLGAVAYVVSKGAGAAARHAVFTGDTLFLAGCGRLFEGTPAQMHASLQSLALLPPATEVYCGHEYTEANLRFARHVEPRNEAVAHALERAKRLRAEGKPTVPSPLAQELAANPFLRAGSEEIRTTLGIPLDASMVDAFAAIRKAKDSFR